MHIQAFRNRWSIATSLVLGTLGLAGAGGCSEPAGQDVEMSWVTPSYGSEFQTVWNDGNGELASYRLTYPCYGQPRTGTAVMVTVTEPFDPKMRVKADVIEDDTYGVLKMNLAEDFQTGLYEYNLMTSVFVPTRPAHGLPAGAAVKTTFSAQEWCGQVFQQTGFGHDGSGPALARHTGHSYFHDQADRQLDLPYPADGLAEDALILWARGLAGPVLEAGQSIQLPVYRSMAVQRMQHLPPEWVDATLTRDPEAIEIQTSTGVFICERLTASVGSGDQQRDYVFLVDQAKGQQRRLVQMDRSDGYRLELLAAERMLYWGLHNNADESELEVLKLRRRDANAM